MNELARKPKRWPKIVSRTFLILVTILLVFPFFWMVLLSFKSDTQILNNPFSLVLDAGFSNYVRAMQVLDLKILFGNTIFLAATTQAVGLIITFMSSYCLSRMVFRHQRIRDGLYLFFLLGLTIPSYILLFPIYRMVVAMHLQNTYLSLILPLIATSIAFNTLLFVGVLRDFPSEVEEAAIIDGCGLFSLCARIVIPVIKPVFATLLVFNVVYVWNEYPLSVTLISDINKMTVSLGASMFRGTYSMDYSGMIAAAVLIILPQLVFYAFFQRFIIEGMTAGAVKG